MIRFNRYFLMILLSFISLGCADAQSYTLSRILTPTDLELKQEKKKLVMRQWQRFAVKGSTALGVVLMMYLTLKAGEYFKEMDKRIINVDKRVGSIEKVVDVSGKVAESGKDVDLLKAVVGNNANPQSSFSLSIVAPIKWFGNGIQNGVSGTKSFVKDLGKCFIETCPTFFTGMILSTLWQQACHRIVESGKQESVSWYIDNYTQMSSLFHDLAVACIPYDLFSSLLSLQQVHDKATGQMTAYVADLSGLVDEHKQKMIDDDYFEYAREGFKKSYVKMGSELAILQNYAAANIAKRKRALDQGLHDASLFQSSDIGKQNMFDLCTLLRNEIQKVVTFAMMHIDNHRSDLSQNTIKRGEKKVSQMIADSNRYFEQMEQLLNMDSAKLESMSVANKGLFTCTYEFERVFKEHIGILHRYCMLIN